MRADGVGDRRHGSGDVVGLLRAIGYWLPVGSFFLTCAAQPASRVLGDSWIELWPHVEIPIGWHGQEMPEKEHNRPERLLVGWHPIGTKDMNEIKGDERHP